MERCRAVAALALTMFPWERRQVGGRYVLVPVQSGTSAFRLPYSRHVVSTFKNLTTTTAHCDLNIFAKQTGPQSSIGTS
jgi:hypothetical protein